MAKIIQKWSLEVVAVPQEDIINSPGSTTADKTLPIKVKIRIKRGKNASFFRERVISVPEIEQANKYTEKVRVIHSNQTIMSFNMLTRPDQKSKAHRKSQNKFFHLFKTGKCLGTQGEDEDDPPYLIATTLKLNEENSKSQESYNNKNISLLQNKCNTKTLEGVTKQPVYFLGKCKPGGCLDPPFGEDTYRYEPSDKLKQEIDLIKKENYKVATSEKKTKRSEVTMKVSNYEEIETLSTFMLYKSKSENSSDEKSSDSIITYPPDASSLDIGSLEKNTMPRKSSAVKKRLSSNATDSYFMPPKLDKSPERNIIKTKININSQKSELNYCNRAHGITVPEDRGTNSPLLESGDLHLVGGDRNIVLKVEERRKPLSSLKIETDKLNEISKIKSNEAADSQYDSQVCQLINLNNVETKLQKTALQTEELNEVNKYRASTDDIISKMAKVIPQQMSNKSSPMFLENNVLRDVKQIKSFTNIENEDNKSLKLMSVEDKISDDFAQDYFSPQTPYDPVHIEASEVNKPTCSEIQTPSTLQKSSSNKSNHSRITFRKSCSESKLTLPDTLETETTELKNTVSYVQQNENFTSNISINDNDTFRTKLKYDSDLRSQVINKVSSEYIHTLKSNTEVHITKSSSNKSNVSGVITEEQTAIQEKSETKGLLLDDTELKIDYNHDDNYDMNMKDEQNSHLIPQKLHSELTINNSLDKSQEKSSKTSLKDYKLEIKSQIGKSQVEDLTQSSYQKTFSKENSTNENANGDYQNNEVRKTVSDIQGIDETSDNMLYKFANHHQKDKFSAENVIDNTSATSGHSKSKTLVHRDTSLLSIRPSTDKYLDNDGPDKRSSINVQHISLAEQSKTYSAEIENNKIIKTNSYVTQKDSITNLKNIILNEGFLENESVSEDVSNNTVPIDAIDVLSNIPTANEIKNISIDHVVHGNENVSDFPNNVKNASIKNNENYVNNTIGKNMNISEDTKININKKSSKNPSFSVPVKDSNKKNPDTKYSKTDKYFNDSYSILKQDIMLPSRKDVKISFEDKKSSVANNINKNMVVDLAFQTYVNENNETILRTLDNSIEPQRFPHDRISVMKSALELNENKLSFTINSHTKLFIETGRDTSAKDEEKSLDIEENILGKRAHTANNKHKDISDIEKLQRSLVAIYENDLVPVEILIRNIIVEIDKIAKYQSTIKNNFIAKRKLRSLKATYCNKRCGCLRKS